MSSAEIKSGTLLLVGVNHTTAPIEVRERLAISTARLADATRTLGEWRRRVARWAESPSGAIPKPAADTMREAFGNLDTVAVVALLNGLAADETLPPGPRFETFLYADRVLGLNLPGDIGR